MQVTPSQCASSTIACLLALTNKPDARVFRSLSKCTNPFRVVPRRIYSFSTVTLVTRHPASMGKLLLCTHNHVELHFPHSGYISHEAMAIALYRSTRPESGSNHLLLDSDSPDLGLTENVDFCPSSSSPTLSFLLSPRLTSKMIWSISRTSFPE